MVGGTLKVIHLSAERNSQKGLIFLHTSDLRLWIDVVQKEMTLLLFSLSLSISPSLIISIYLSLSRFLVLPKDLLHSSL